MDEKHPWPFFLVHDGAPSRRRQTLDGLPIIAGDIARVDFYFKAFLLDEKCGSRSELFSGLAPEAAPPRCSAAVYDNVCVFTALIVISVLAGASRCKTLALPLGRSLKIPTDSALKIFAFIYSVGESKFEGLVLFSAVFHHFPPEVNPKKQISICIPPPNQPRTSYKSAIEMLEKVQQVYQNNFYLFQNFTVFLEYLVIQSSTFRSLKLRQSPSFSL